MNQKVYILLYLKSFIQHNVFDIYSVVEFTSHSLLLLKSILLHRYHYLFIYLGMDSGLF